MFLIYALYILLTHTLAHTLIHTRTHIHMLADTFIKYAAYAVLFPVPSFPFPIPVPLLLLLFLFPFPDFVYFLLSFRHYITLHYELPETPRQKTLACWPSLSLSLCLPLVHVMHRVGAADSVAGHPRVEAGHALHVDILHRRSQYALLLFVLFGRLRRRRRRRR